MADLDKNVLAMRYIAKLLRTIQYGDPIPELYDGLSWRGVYVVSNKHSLASTVWYPLEDVVTPLGDGELISRWNNQRDTDYLKNVAQTAEFEKITRLFTENKIAFLPMKGFIFKAMWKSPEYRTMADLDIYISKSDMKRSIKLLSEHGYKKGLDDEDLHYTMKKPPFVSVELHRAVRRGSTESFERWHPKAENPYWYVMSDTDFVVFNVTHIYKHYIHGGCGARTLFDMHIYLESNIATLDMNAIKERLEAEGIYPFFEKLLCLMHLWYGDGEPSYPVSKEYLKDGIASPELLEMEYFISTGGSYGNVDNKVEKAIEGRSRAGYIFSRAFPPFKSMRQLYPWLKYLPFLLPIGYIIRLVHALFDGRLRREMSAVDKHTK